MSRLTRIGDLAEQVRGVSYAGGDASQLPLPGHLPIIRGGNITDDGLSFDDLVFVPAERVSSRQKVRQHDIVIAASSGSLEVVGKAARALADYEAGFGAFCKVLRPGPNVDPRYFGHFFRTRYYRRQVSASAAGANINNLRNEDLDRIEIPIPSMGEQRRIADILDIADALRAKRRAGLAQLDVLAQAMFEATFGAWRNGSHDWPTTTFEHIVADTKLGLVRGAKDLGYDRRYPYVRMNAITKSGKLELDRLLRVDASESEVESHSLAPGDLLFNTRNSSELVGKTALFRGEGQYLFNNNIMRTRFNSTVDPEFVAAAFRTPFIQRELDARKSGTTSVFAIYYKDLKSLPIPLPPLELQREFGERIKQVEAIRRGYSASLAGLDALFASLQYRAFRGDL